MRKLMNGTRVTLRKMFDAGMYKISSVEQFSEKLVLEISGGQPYSSARKISEQLAVLCDAEYVIGEDVARESLRGEYWEPGTKEDASDGE